MGRKYGGKKVFIKIRESNDAIIAHFFHFHSHFARKGLSYTTKMFIHVVYICTNFFYFRLIVNLEAKDNIFLLSKRQCFGTTFVPTRIRIQESQINADPEHSDKIFSKNLHYL